MNDHREGMRIETLRPPSLTPARRAEKRGTTAGFSGLIRTDDEVLHETSPTTPASALTSLISIQLDEGSKEAWRERKQAVVSAHEALDVLAQVQRALALGQLTSIHLQNLTNRLSQPSAATNDPKLDEIRADIQLRLAVEAAKLEYARNIPK
jgi:Class II flagellar assembly regulator